MPLFTSPAEIRARAEKWAESLANNVTQSLREKSPEVFDELRTALRHPRTLGSWIEKQSPWLNRRFLGAASNWVEPFTIGMGFVVEKLSEQSVEVLMPGGWRNQGENGTVHASALTALGEFAARVFWERHLDMRWADTDVSRVQVRLLARPTGEMRAVFRLPVADREAILHRLRADGRVPTETQTQIYDREGRLVAEVEVDWELRKQLLLGSSSR